MVGQHQSIQRRVPRGPHDEKRLTADIVELACIHLLAPPHDDCARQDILAGRAVAPAIAKVGEGQNGRAVGRREKVRLPVALVAGSIHKTRSLG